MKMRINVYAVLGSIIGWFVITPIIPPFIKTTPIELLERGIIGLLLAIFLGLIFGTWDEYFEARLEHARLMARYNKVKKEIEERIKELEAKNGRLRTKKRK
jgi:predicted membrane chloride channel (bestrophin family)